MGMRQGRDEVLWQWRSGKGPTGLSGEYESRRELANRIICKCL